MIVALYVTLWIISGILSDIVGWVFIDKAKYDLTLARMTLAGVVGGFVPCLLLIWVANELFQKVPNFFKISIIKGKSK